MRTYTVYYNPLDYPGEYVVRGWTIGRSLLIADDDLYARGKTLEEVRESMPPNMDIVPRDERDEPQIVEVWL